MIAKNDSTLDLECWVDGLCNGVLVGETFGLDSNGCLGECQANDDCLWFTHDSDGDICLMFQDCQAFDTSCDTCLSSQTQCSPLEEPVNPGMIKDLTKIKTLNYYIPLQ